MSIGEGKKTTYAWRKCDMAKVQHRLERDGVPTERRDLGLQGRHFAVHYAEAGTSPDGTRWLWRVLRFNPDTQPSSRHRQPGDIDYTDSSARTIPAIEEGGWDAGIARVMRTERVLGSCLVQADQDRRTP